MFEVLHISRLMVKVSHEMATYSDRVLAIVPAVFLASSEVLTYLCYIYAVL